MRKKRAKERDEAIRLLKSIITELEVGKSRIISINAQSGVETQGYASNGVGVWAWTGRTEITIEIEDLEWKR